MKTWILTITVLVLLVVSGHVLNEPKPDQTRYANEYWQNIYARHLAYYTEFWCSNSRPQGEQSPSCKFR